MSRRTLDSMPLAVADELRGRELGTPLRRGLAFAVDSLLLFVPTVAMALAASAAVLALSDPGALRALTRPLRGRAETPEDRRAMWRDLAPLLARLDAPGLPPGARSAAETGDLDAAVEELVPLDIDISLAIGGSTVPSLAPGHVRVELEKLIPAPVRGAALFSVPALYFTLLTAGRRGRTVGKRVTGIEVRRLDGRPLGVFGSLERFGGYFAVPGTIGLGLLDLWRDRNRRLSPDRIAGTVVVRSRRPTTLKAPNR